MMLFISKIRAFSEGSLQQAFILRLPELGVTKKKIRVPLERTGL